ncbi:MAG: hypothetical protein ACTIL2_01320 [Corynebacterium sp.]
MAGAGLLLGSAACSSDDSGNGNGSGDGSDADPSDLALTDSAAPAGYDWNDVGEVLSDEGFSDDLQAPLIDPEQCAALDPSALSVLVELRDNQDTSAAVEFLPHDETDPAIVNAIVSTDPDFLAMPEDISECETFTQTSEEDPQAEPVTYQASAEQSEIVGAEDTEVITIVSDSEGAGGGEATSIVTGTVNGVAFRVSGSGIEEPRILMDLVDRQVDQIREHTDEAED